MERIYVADRTLKQAGRRMPLSFREKIELSRLIDRLEPDVIELAPIENRKVDSLLIKSIAASVRHGEIAVPVRLTEESVTETWNALKEAQKPRLQVVAPVSSVQMEYLSHQKPAALASLVIETIRECGRHTDNIEFIAEDAFRGEESFMIPLIQSAMDAGAKRITFQEAAGAMLPEEMRDFLEGILSQLDRKNDVRFGVDCSDALPRLPCLPRGIPGGCLRCRIDPQRYPGTENSRLPAGLRQPSPCGSHSVRPGGEAWGILPGTARGAAPGYRID